MFPDRLLGINLGRPRRVEWNDAPKYSHSSYALLPCVRLIVRICDFGCGQTQAGHLYRKTQARRANHEPETGHPNRSDSNQQGRLSRRGAGSLWTGENSIQANKTDYSTRLRASCIESGWVL